MAEPINERDVNLENLCPNAPSDPGAHTDVPKLTILHVLEQQLAALDSVQAYIAAAYVDAAIQQLRAELARGAWNDERN